MGSGGVETPTLTPDDIAELKAKIDAKEITLTSGHHDVSREHKACAMDLIVWKATGKISDTAECVHPLIASHIHGLNDAAEATSESRWELVEHAGPAILGTSGLPAAHVRFALRGVRTGIQLATNLAKFKTDGAPSVLIEWINAQGPTTGNRSAAATTGNRSAAATTGNDSAAATTGYRSAAATTGDYSAAATAGYDSAAATTGDYSAAATTGNDSAAATTGDYSAAATTGNRSAAATAGYDSAAATTGDYSAAATTGYRSAAATTGYRSAAATTGYDSAAATTGDDSAAATTGDDSAAATTGNDSAAATTGNDSAAACLGWGGKAKAGLGGSIVIAWSDGKRQRIAVGYPGEDGIEADTWYRCGDAGKLVEVTP